MSNDSDAAYMHQKLDMLESTCALFGYFSQPIFTDKEIRETYANVCIQASDAKPTTELYPVFQRNALFQLRIAEAQTMLWHITGKEDIFNNEKTKALNAITHLIPLEKIITQFWHS